jgi:hypothetical protein
LMPCALPDKYLDSDSYSPEKEKTRTPVPAELVSPVLPPRITPLLLDLLLVQVLGRRKGDTTEKCNTNKTRVALAKNACVNRMV